jgi:hypothetical protein
MCNLVNAGVGVQDQRGYHLRYRCLHCGATALALHNQENNLEYEDGATPCAKGVTTVTIPPPAPVGGQTSLF